ncbi:MAG TPA: hypothetical protein VGM39_00260 [Kofleriaceae bacterium]
MKYLALVALILPACLPLPSAPDAKTEPLTVNYKVLGPGDSAGRCPSTFDTLVIGATEDYETGSQGFAEYIPCESSGTYTYELPTAGRTKVETGNESQGDYFVDGKSRYDVQLSLTNADHESQDSNGLIRRIDLTTGTASADLELYVNGTPSVASWTFSTSGANPSCSDVDVDEVELSYWPYDAEDDDGVPDPTMVTTTTYPCETHLDANLVSLVDPDVGGQTLTKVLKPGQYYGTFKAKHAGTVVATDDELSFDVDVDSIGTIETSLDID